jgi:hypothetical protein
MAQDEIRALRDAYDAQLRAKLANRDGITRNARAARRRRISCAYITS